MGIVVTFAMLLGLIILRPSPWRHDYREKQDLRLVTFTSSMLVLLGLWNTLWYGLRHLGDFWGWAAVLSGIAMLSSAFIIIRERSDPTASSGTFLGAIRGFVVGGLAISFLLYAVTIIQINMGLPILGT